MDPSRLTVSAPLRPDEPWAASANVTAKTREHADTYSAFRARSAASCNCCSSSPAAGIGSSREARTASQSSSSASGSTGSSCHLPEIWPKSHRGLARGTWSIRRTRREVLRSSGTRQAEPACRPPVHPSSLRPRAQNQLSPRRLHGPETLDLLGDRAKPPVPSSHTLRPSSLQILVPLHEVNEQIKLYAP